MKKKLLSVLLCAVIAGTLLAGCGKSEEESAPAASTEEGAEQETPAEEPAAEEEAPAAAAGGTIYILGPTPDHGWTAQAGVYAEQKAEEINSKGEYKGVYMSASSGEEQVDQVQTILANGDAVGVVFFALEDSAKAGQDHRRSRQICYPERFRRQLGVRRRYRILAAAERHGARRNAGDADR